MPWRCSFRTGRIKCPSRKGLVTRYLGNVTASPSTCNLYDLEALNVPSSRGHSDAVCTIMHGSTISHEISVVISITLRYPCNYICHSTLSALDWVYTILEPCRQTLIPSNTILKETCKTVFIFAFLKRRNPSDHCSPTFPTQAVRTTIFTSEQWQNCSLTSLIEAPPS